MRPGGAVVRALVAAALLAGCGRKHAGTTPAAADGAAESSHASGGEMVPPEKMDEINRSLERKRQIMAHCLATAVDNKELPRNARGKVTVEIVIANGRAENVKVVRASLESTTLNECVISHVKEIQFPDLPKPYETSYTYGFEAM